MTTDFKQEKDLVYYLGPIDFEQTYYSTLHPDLQQLPEIKLKENKLRYELLHKLISNKMINSSHDISEGGIITSVIESLFPQKLGFNFESSALAPNESIEAFLFNEIPGGFILSVSPEARNKFETLTQNQARFLGVINTSETITYDNQLNLNINELHKLWSRDEY